MGYTESRQSSANQGIPRFACNPDLNHAVKSLFGAYADQTHNLYYGNSTVDLPPSA